ncbi:UNVERIFIED_CONTAM: hypothetical protein B566_EDAN011705 [Ephemera danica]|nr:hypothetical protein B566_EDAN011705 [Ephemera danica]
MALPTAKEVTNQYLYEQTTKPTDLVKDSLIRPAAYVAPMNIDINEYVAGPGRFVTPGAFTIVERFLNPWLYSGSSTLGPGTYTKNDLYTAFGIPEGDSRRWVSIQQWAYDDGRDDWMERAYVWNTTAFKIVDDVRFVVEYNGNRYIDNYGIREYVNTEKPENFDLVGGDTAAWLFNSIAGPQIDPSKIGRKVNFTFTGTPTTARLNYIDYVKANSTRTTANPLLAVTGAANLQNFLDRLFNNGPTKFVDTQGHAILYGSNNSDSISGTTSLSGRDIDSDARLGSYARNGVTYIAGKGNDSITGTTQSDMLYGNDDNDVLTGGKGNDHLQGGKGNDTYRFTAGDGVDVIRDEDGQGSIEVDGQTLTGGKKVADGYWLSEDNQFAFALVKNGSGGHDLIISRGQINSILIRGWKNNQLGIILDGVPVDIDPPTLHVMGDLKPVEFVSVDGDGNVHKYYEYDSYGNVITDEEEPGFADVLFGSGENDHLSGGEGNDGISGYAGNDHIEGGAGDDLLSGGAGRDHILGGTGADYIYAGGTHNGKPIRGPEQRPYQPPANATIVGATWAVYPSEAVLDGKPTAVITVESYGFDDPSDEGDVVDAGTGDDLVDGGYGNDLIDGGYGDDHLRGGAGNDVIEGGVGEDYIRGDSTRFAILFGDISAEKHGNDVLSGGEGADSMYGQGGNDNLYGGAGNDKLWGDSSDLKDTPPEYAGQDTLDGGDGNDQLIGGAKDDEIFGGKDNDRLWGDDNAEKLPGEHHGNDRLDGEEGQDLLSGGGGADVLLGGDGADNLFGDEPSDKLDAQYQGDDLIKGEAGDDYAEGGGGNDEIYGGADNDILWGDASTDVLSAEHHGDDVLDGEDGNDNLIGNGGADYLSGGAGNDQLFGDSAFDGGRIDGQYQGDDLLDGGGGNDFLEGGGGADILLGGVGDDKLLGDGDSISVPGEFSGDDVLLAGEGNDSAWGDGGNDVIEGGAGDDQLHGDANANELEGRFHGHDGLSGGDGKDTLIGGGGSDTLVGGVGNDYLHGDDEGLDAAYHGDDLLDGGEGDDVLFGGAGNDRLFGGAGNDVLSAGDGDDQLNGGEGSNALEGGEGNDDLYGGSEADALSGGAGDDRLVSGGGRDLLKGGAGSDTYVIASGDALIQDTDGVNTLFWKDAGVDLEAIAKGKDGGLSVRLLQFGAGGSAGGGSYGFQGSTNDLASVVPLPLAGQYVRIESAGASVLVQGGLDANFGDITDAAGQRISWEQLLAQAVRRYVAPYNAVDNSRWYGTGGNDELISDTSGYKFVGGQGNDTLTATGRGNIFYYSPGDGTDTLTIVDPAANNGGNTLRFGPGVTPDDIKLGLGSLLIRVGEDPADAIHIEDFNPDDVLAQHPVDRFEFADGTVLSYEELLQRGFDIEGSEEGDTLRGTNVADRLTGYEGNDALQGGAGDDTYAYQLGDGNDQMLDTDTTANNLDRLRLGGGILSDEVTVTRNYHDVTLRFIDGGSVTLVGQLDGEGRGIERVEFADGTTWLPDELLARAGDQVVGRFGNDMIHAGRGDDRLFGAYTYDALWSGYISDEVYFGDEGYGGGEWESGGFFADNDEIHGGFGNDWLDGGYRADHDTLYGGSGDDSYVFRRGSGDDRVVESGDATNADRVVMENLYRDEVTFARAGDDLLVNLANTDDRLTIRGFFADATAVVEYFDFKDVSLSAEALRVDLLLGTAGDDDILGYTTDDTLSGGAGNDRLDGGEGSDTYTFALGDGRDTLADSGADGADVIRFNANILPADVAVTRSESDLLLVVRSTGERVIVEAWFGDTGPSIESVMFDNGTVWSPSELTAWASTPAMPGSNDDFIVGSDASEAINALAGNDEIRALAGDDQLTGGTGDDLLFGGSGNDTYIYQQGDGSDVIDDKGRGDTDILTLGDGINPNQVVVKRDAAHLYLQLPDGETITVENWFGDAANRLAAVQFADGTAWNTEELEALANTPTNGDDFIVGGLTDDFIAALAGDDLIQGQAGNDLLTGGSGADRLDGGSGDDVYVFNAGDGADQIVDVDGYDRIEFGTGIAPEEIQVFADPDGAIVLQRYGTGDQIRIAAKVTNQWGRISVTPVLESFKFADGTVWTADDVAAYAGSVPTTGSDYLRGSGRPEIIDGLGGNDYASGGWGDDSYVFKPGYGQLTIDEFDGYNDTLIFGDGIAPDDLIVRRNNTSLILEVTGTEDRVRVESQFGTWNGNRIERIVFADGTEWNIADVEWRLEVPEGSSGDDNIYGSGRNDTINGLAGNDLLDSGAGDDVLDGGSGADEIYGGAGDDVLDGGSGADEIYGGDGNDTYVINADSGYDQITDTEGSNRIVLGQGLSAENVIISDSSSWGAGQTRIDFGSGAVYVDAGSRIDRIESADGVVITADALNTYRLTSISGTSSADVLIGTHRPNKIYGDKGNDLIHGGAGRDSLDGGAGNDSLFGDGGDDTIEDWDGNYNFIDGGTGNDTLTGHGYLVGGAGNDSLRGDGILDGGAGNDRLNAYRGAVILFGEGSGNDVIDGSIPSEGFVIRTNLQPSDVEIVGGKVDGLELPLILRIVATGESLTGINGAASVVFADGSAWSAADIAAHARVTEPIATVGNDVLLGSSGDDVLAAGEGNDRIAGGAGADTLDGASGDDILYGGDGNDILFGGDGRDELTGGGGNDVLDGGAGADYYYEGTGIDTIRFGRGSGRDFFFERGMDGAQSPLTIVEMGADVLPDDISVARDYASVFFMVKNSEDSLAMGGWLGQEQPASALEVRFADGTVWNTETVLSMLPAGMGDFRDNMLTGNDEGNYILGYAGNDDISGGAEGDDLFGDSGDDSLSGGTGNDSLNGGDGADALFGGEGDDELTGGGGSDTLDGGAGNDDIMAYEEDASADTVLFGFGSGEDTLYSSDGRDVVQLGDGVRLQDVEINFSGSDLQIRLAGGADTLRISDWAYSSDIVSTLRFADGSEIDLRDFSSGVVIGSEAADTITDAEASPFDHHLYGKSGNDTLNGGRGDDVIHGGDGDDFLAGSTGRNVLDGGAGNDTYYLTDYSDTLVFGFNTGQDYFYDNHLNDGNIKQPQTIRLESNVQPGDVLIKNVWLNEKEGSFSLGLKGSSATLSGFKIRVDQEGNPIISSRLVFGDGTVIEGKDALQTLYYSAATEGGDYLLDRHGDDVIEAGAGSDVVLAGTGDDQVFGGTGNDTLSGGQGNDTLLGGAGDDALVGGEGHNVYRFEAGFGRDTIFVQSYGESLDVIEFGEGIRPEDVVVSRRFQEGSWYPRSFLVLDVPGSGSQISIENGWITRYGSSGSALNLANIRFADGTTWQTADIAARLLVSTSGDDALQGSTGSDYIAAKEGNDDVRGAEGNDVLLGGAGNDLVDGGAGTDRLQGDDGDDQLTGGEGSDLQIGGHGDDMLIGGNGNDVYRFSRGDGHDIVGDFGLGLKDVDTIEFGSGISLSDITREVVDGSLILRVAGGDDSITIVGFDRPSMVIERIRFSDGTIIDPVSWIERNREIALDAGDGIREIAGDSRYDSLEIGAGIDPDTVTVTREGTDLVLRNGTDGVRFADWFSDSVSQQILQARFADGTVWSAEELSRQASNLTGSADDDTLEADGGFPALISGGAGNDTLVGSHGDDVLQGGDGHDVLIGGMGHDLLEGGAGDDLYVVDDLSEAVELAGGGVDTVRLATTQDIVVSGEIENFEVLGTAPVSLTGNAADNRLVGNSAINRIEGGAGNDVLDGGASADILMGGSGDDRYMADNAADTIIELAGEGNDTVAASISWALNAGSNIENIELLGEGYLNASGDAAANTLIGNAGRNVIRGYDGNDTLDGGGNADVLYGGRGDDRYRVDDAGDQVVELAGEGYDNVVSTASFVLPDFVENLALVGSANLDATGNTADNHLTGNAGDNNLSGGAGNDVLDGAAGNDVSFGGAGNDSYVFGRGYGQDVIVENGAASVADCLLLGDGVLPSDLLLRRNGDDLLVSLRDTSDRLTIRNYWQTASTVESILFAEGTIWGQSQVEAAIAATPLNTDPTVMAAAADQMADVGQQFEFSMAGVFGDSDAGDVLIPKVTLANGDPLPRWLSFDATTRTFRGTPGEGDVGTISIVMLVSESANRMASDQFDLFIRNPNDTSPIVFLPLADRHGRQDVLLSFGLPKDAFKDADVGDHLTYSATLADGQPLPRWLSFDPVQRAFVGIPGKDDVGTFSVSVTAHDSRGRTVTDSFDIVVDDVNDPPRVQRLITDQVLWQGQSIDVGLPADLFVDREGDTVAIQVTLANGDPLPAWLSYDRDASRIIGTTNTDSVGITTIRITGTDSHGLAAYEDFDVVVGDVNDAPVLTTPVGNMTAREGRDAYLSLPPGLFADPDRGDALTYSLECLSAPAHAKSTFDLNSSNGAMTLHSSAPVGEKSPFVYYDALDYWDIGTWTFKLTAEDRLGLKTTTEFTVDVQAANMNHIPVVATSTSEPWNVFGQTWNSERGVRQWNLAVQEVIVVTMDGSIPINMPSFVDVDGDFLSISVLPEKYRTANGWVYNQTEGTLRYQGAEPLQRSQVFDIIADDGHGGRSMTKINVVANRKPVIEDIPEIVVREHQAFSITLPDSTFYDPDGDTLFARAEHIETYNPLTRKYETLARYEDSTKTIYGQAGDFGVGTHYLTLEAIDPFTSFDEVPDADAKKWVKSTTKQVKITVLNEYDAPRLIAPLSDLAVQEDQSLYLYTSNAFYSVDRDQTLRYSATLSNGEALPSWLSLNSANGVLSGVPRTDQVGNYSIRIMATDLAGARISDDFDLAVTLAQRNHAPRLTNPVTDQIYRGDQNFSFQLPRNTFSDIDAGDTLIYRALQDNGGPLPNWIQFDAATLTFSGHVPVGQRAPTEIRIVATDSKGAEATDVFSVGIDGITLPPVVATPAADQVAIEDAPFTLVLPSGEFADLESSGGLALSASLMDGSPLPAWLAFDAATATFSGTPGNGDVGNMQVRVIATEPDGGTVSDIFQLAVQNINDAPITTGESYTLDAGMALDLAATTLLANDLDIDPTHDVLTISAVGDAVHGSVELLADGHVRFAAEQGYAGSAGFTYTVSDGQGGLTNTSVEIDVQQTVSAPVALDGEVVIEEDASRVLTVSDFGFTDTDGPDDLQSIVIVAAPITGRLILNGKIVVDGTSVLRSQLDAGLLVFTPDQDGNGAAYANIAFQVENGLVSANTGLLHLNVTPVNDAPGAFSDDGTIDEDAVTPLLGSLLANDQDVDTGTTLRIVAPGIYAGRFGSLSVNAAGTYSYQLDNGLEEVQALADGEYLTDTFGYAVTDGIASDSAELTIKILGQNDRPIVMADSGTIGEDDPDALALDLLANDSDVDGVLLRVTDPGTQHGNYGSLTVTSDGQASYRLNNDSTAVQALGVGQTVVDQFVVAVGDAQSSVANEISIVVHGANDAPETIDDIASVSEGAGGTAQGNVLANDRDIDQGSTLTVATPGTQMGLYGTLMLEADGSYSYTLDNALSAVQQLEADETLNETFVYEASDGLERTMGTLRINIVGRNDAPVANVDQAEVAEDGVTTVSGNLLANDQDDDRNGVLQVVDVGSRISAYGSLQLSADGAYTYVLDNTSDAIQALAAGEVVTETFGYTITDGIASSSASLTVTINGSNDAPVVTADVASLAEDTLTQATGNVLANDSDVDAGDTLTVADAGVRVGAYGTLTLNTDGGYAYALNHNAVQSLAAGQQVIEQFDYALSDQSVQTQGNIEITIAGENDVPVAEADSAYVNAGNASQATGNVLVNDSDIDAGDALSVLDHGTRQGQYGTLTLNADGSYAYTLNPLVVQSLGVNQTLNESFDYLVSDGITDAGSALTVTIAGSNDAPVVTADIENLTEDTLTQASGNVLTNDSDPDNGAILTVGTPGIFIGTYGVLNLATDGSYSYLLDTDKAQSLAQGQSVDDVFSYTATDGIANVGSTLTLHIAGGNDAPVVTVDTGTISENAAAPLASNVLINDSDVDVGMVLQVGDSGSRTGSYGTLNLAANGQYIYALTNSDALQSLAAGEVVHDMFSYAATDGIASTRSSLDITVVGENDAPIVARQIGGQSTQSGQAFSFQFSTDTFTDVDHGDTLAYSAKLTDGGTLPAWLSFNAVTRTFSGTPAAGNAGNLSINLTATDNAGASASQTFALAKPLADKTIAPDHNVSWKIPSASLVDIDQGDSFAYSAQLANGSALPSWLKFDAATQTFSGKAPKNTKGSLDIVVAASDGHEAQSVSDTFRLTFNKNGLKGNEGLGNGEDPPPPGHDCNRNDGGASSPGHPGSQGGHHGHDDDPLGRFLEGFKRDDQSAQSPPALNRRWFEQWGAPAQAPASGQAGHGQAGHAQASHDVARHWAALTHALNRLDAERQSMPAWHHPNQGADIKGLAGWIEGSGQGAGGGVDTVSLACGTGTHLKGFSGIREGMGKLSW